jgi:hypothetical protein
MHNAHAFIPVHKFAARFPPFFFHSSGTYELSRRDPSPQHSVHVHFQLVSSFSLSSSLPCLVQVREIKQSDHYLRCPMKQSSEHRRPQHRVGRLLSVLNSTRSALRNVAGHDISPGTTLINFLAASY